MATRMQQRRGTSSQWTAANPVLADGEIGFEKDTGVVKMGNGVSTWNQLSPILGSSYLPLLGKAYDSERLDGLDSTAFALASTVTDLTSSTSPTRKLSYHWGSGIAYPTEGLLVGDTYFHTELYSLMRYNGTAWRQAEPAQGTAAQRAAIATTLLHAGFQFYETNAFKVNWLWTGTAWRAISQVFGKLWRSLAFGGNMAANTSYSVVMDKDRVAGGFVANHDTSGTAGTNMGGNCLVLPFDGFYRIDYRGYASGGPTPADCVFDVMRTRASVADVKLAMATGGRPTVQDSTPAGSTPVPLKAGDKVWMKATAGVNSANINYWGVEEGSGVMLAATYEGPLNGTTPL